MVVIAIQCTKQYTSTITCHTTILLCMLSIPYVYVISQSLSESLSGVSIEIFIKQERLLSPIRFLNRVFISFICEKLLSMEAVRTGIARQMFERVLRWGTLFDAFHLYPILSAVTARSLLAVWKDNSLQKNLGQSHLFWQVKIHETEVTGSMSIQPFKNAVQNYHINFQSFLLLSGRLFNFK